MSQYNDYLYFITKNQFIMKNFISILFLSFAIISCEAPSSGDSDFPTFIDSEELEELANTIQDALNSGDLETALTYYDDEVSWLFPNGVEVEGKEAVGEMLKTTSSMWDITSSDDTNYLAFEGSDENEEGEEVRFRVLTVSYTHLPLPTIYSV